MPAKNGSSVGVKNTVMGQPPRPPLSAKVAAMSAKDAAMCAKDAVMRAKDAAK